MKLLLSARVEFIYSGSPSTGPAPRICVAALLLCFGSMTQALVPVLFLTDPSDAPCSVPSSRASPRSLRFPWRWTDVPVILSTALE